MGLLIPIQDCLLSTPRRTLNTMVQMIERRAILIQSLDSVGNSMDLRTSKLLMKIVSCNGSFSQASLVSQGRIGGV